MRVSVREIFAPRHPAAFAILPREIENLAYFAGALGLRISTGH